MSDLDLPGFGTTFMRKRVSARGATLNVIEGGSGSPLVLVAGWPQSWYAWRKVIPQLARRHRVIAVDLPGLGDSEPSRVGYDTAAIASHIDPLLDVMGIDKAMLVAHDIGTWVAYAYAIRQPQRVERLVLTDAAIPGLTESSVYRMTPEAMLKTWHFAFNFLPDLPEALIVGRERAFLTWLFRSKSVDWTKAFDGDALDEYVRLYARDGRWTAGLGYYRAIFDTMAQNQATSRTPLPMPVLAIGGETGLGAAMGRSIGPTVDLQGAVIPNCGHYVPEESPQAFLGLVEPFLNS